MQISTQSMTGLQVGESPRGERDAAGAAQVKSVAKAAWILRAFEPGRGVLTVREIAEHTCLPRSTCHAICTTLVAENLLELLPAGGYRLADSLVEMGGQVIERVGLVEAAMPLMVALSRTTSSEVHLGQVARRWIVYLSRMTPDRGAPMRNRVGLRVPLHRTGCGKAALAQLDPRRALELARPGIADEAEAGRLLADLARARRTGFAVSDSFQSGVISVAAAVLALDGTAVGGISVARPAHGLTRTQIAALGASVTRAAAETSQRLCLRRP